MYSQTPIKSLLVKTTAPKGGISMSNPAVYLLAETTIQGKRIQIEDNLGESIHVHIGEFRITFSVAEFLEAAESILNAADQILQLKDLSLYKFDLSSLDWDWLSR